MHVNADCTNRPQQIYKSTYRSIEENTIQIHLKKHNHTILMTSTHDNRHS